MRNISCSSSTFKQFLNILADFICQDNGLKYLSFSGFKPEMNLDIQILERLVRYSANLEVLIIENMNASE